MYKEYENVLSNEVYEYLRKSRSDDPLLSVEEVLAKHESELNDFAEKYLGGRVPSNQIIREVASSETIDDRPGMVRLLKIIESPNVKAVLVIEPQRLSRGDLEDVGRIIKLFRYTNTLIITPMKTYDLRDEYDRDAFERELKRGNEYLEYAKKIMNRGKIIAVKEGNYIGTYAPYGYKKIHYKEGNIKCSTLEIVPEQAEVVRMIYDMYINENKGFDRIAETLNNLGYSPIQCERWKDTSVKDILSNITYTGKVRWNYRKTVKSIENQEVKKSRPRNSINEYLVFEGKHEAIISDEIFNKAQEKRGKNVPIRKNMSIINPLAGIFHCAKCGKSMKLRPANGKNKARYECNEMKYCGNGSVTQDDLLERIYEILEECIEDFEVKLSQSDNLDEITKHQQLVESLEKRLKDLESKELAQWEAQSHPDESQRMPPHIFKKLNEKLLKEKKELREALCAAKDNVPEKVDYEERILSFKTALNYLRDTEVSPELKNKFLKEIIDDITFSRPKPFRPTKEQARELGVENMPKLYWYNYPFELNINFRV